MEFILAQMGNGFSVAQQGEKSFIVSIRKSLESNQAFDCLITTSVTLKNRDLNILKLSALTLEWKILFAERIKNLLRPFFGFLHPNK